jgi:putative inorganic carbon (hco3(-)) transporter
MPRLGLAGPWLPLLAACLACGGFLVGLVGGVHGASDDVYDIGFALALLPVLGAMAMFVSPSITLTVGLGLAVFSGNWGHLGSPVALDRLLIVTAVAGIALRARDDPRYRPRILPVHWVLLIAALYATGSAWWVGTLDHHDPLFALLDRFGLISFLLFLIAPLAFATDEQRSHLLVGLVAVGAYLGFTALVEELNLNGLVFPGYILDPFVGIHADRTRGPFVEAGANGLAMFACAVAAAMAAGRWRGWARGVAIAIGILCLTGILFTVTRQAWLGAALGALVGLSVTSRLRAYAPLVIGGGVLLVVVAFSVVPGLRERAERRASDQKPLWDRLNSGRAALDMVADRPILGFGWGRFDPESEPYYTLAPDYPITRIPALHSVALSNAVELGLVGATLWAAGLLMALAGALLRRGPPELQPWRHGLLAMAVCWVVVSNFTPLGYTFSNYLLWIWAGVAGAGAAREKAFDR